MTEEIINLRSLIQSGQKLAKIDRLEQENRELRKANEISIEKVTVTAEAKRLQELEQENKELKEKYAHVLELAKTNADSNEYCLQELEKKYKQLRSALEEIREIITSNNSMIIDKKVYFELQCGEPVTLKLQKIYSRINEVLGNEKVFD